MNLIRLKEKHSQKEYFINANHIAYFYSHSVSIDDIATRVFFKIDGTFLDFKVSCYDLEKMITGIKIFDESTFAGLKHD